MIRHCIVGLMYCILGLRIHHQLCSQSKGNSANDASVKCQPHNPKDASIDSPVCSMQPVRDTARKEEENNGSDIMNKGRKTKLLK